MLAMNNISRQLIVLAFMALTIFAIAVSGLVGYQSYHDMEDIALERVEGAAKLYSAEFESEVLRTFNAFSDLESSRGIIEKFNLLNTYGPIYDEENSETERKLTQAELNYYLQSQLELSRNLIYLLPLYNLSKIAIYQTSPFKQFAISQPLPSIIIKHNEILLYRYSQKTSTPIARIYSLPIGNIYDMGNIFDVSSIYQKDADYFYNLVGAVEIQDKPVDWLNALNRPKTYSAGQVLNTFEDKLNVSIWSPVLLNIVDPNTWQKTLKQTAIIIGMYTPTNSTLQEISQRIGTDLAISDDDHVWISSVNQKERDKISENNVNVNKKPYIFSEVKIDLPSDNDNQYNIMSLSSTEDLSNRVTTLIFNLIAITAFVLLTTCISIYLFIQRKLRRPLDTLLIAVKNIQQGDFETKVDINLTNEFSTLAHSFNEMTDQISIQSHALKKANDTLELKVQERTNELKDTQQQLIISEKMASLGQLVAGVAHEINTPLGNSITALTFNEDALSKIQKKFVDKTLTITDFGNFLDLSAESMSIMSTNLHRASELVKTFKNVAVNQSVEELSTFNLLVHVNEVITTLSAQLKKTNIKINVDIHSNIEINSFSGAYYHIISNMIMNCLKHAFPDQTGTIEISATQDLENIYIKFTDDGIGMDSQTIKKIFEPFYTTKRGEGGTGLGMYITYNIVTQRLAGNIEVTSKVGQGTCFNITLPIKIDLSTISDNTFSV